MFLTNIQCCFEDYHKNRGWFGLVANGQIGLDEAELFVRTLASYSQAGLRQILVTEFDQHDRALSIRRQEQRLYHDPPDEDLFRRITHLGVFKIQCDQDGKVWELFVPAFRRQKGEGGTIIKDGRKHGQPFVIQSEVTDRITTALAVLIGATPNALYCVYSALRDSWQRGYVIKHGEHLSPIAQPESPIEEIFWQHAQTAIPGLVAQYEIPPYRVDFAIPEKRIAIELDGYRYHTPVEHRLPDAQRERALQMQGWRVIRFLGTEIQQDAAACVTQLQQMIEAM